MRENYDFVASVTQVVCMRPVFSCVARHTTICFDIKSMILSIIRRSLLSALQQRGPIIIHMDSSHK